MKKFSGVYQIQAEVIKAWSIKFLLCSYTYYLWVELRGITWEMETVGQGSSQLEG